MHTAGQCFCKIPAVEIWVSHMPLKIYPTNSIFLSLTEHLTSVHKSSHVTNTCDSVLYMFILTSHKNLL